MNISIPTFKAFNNFNYCLIWVSTTLMICSHQMVALAQSYWIYDNTGSATILGVVGIAAAIPLLFIAPIGGAVADRFNQKKLMIMCQTLQMSFAWAVVILLVMDLMVWQHLLVIGLGYGIIWATNGPARQALLPKILDKSVLPNGIALITAGMSIAGLIAPAIAGVLYAKFSPEFVFFVSSMLSVISLVIALFIRMPKSKAEVKVTKITSDAIDGLKYLWSDTPTRMILIIGMVFFFMESPVHSLLSVLVVDVYKLESEGLGLLAAMLGVGGLVGNVFIASMPPKKRGLIFIFLAFLSGCALMGVSLIPVYMAGVIILTFQGFAGGGQYPMMQILMLKNMDPKYYGRIMSIIMMFFGFMPLAVLPAGIASDILGIRTIIIILGVGLLVTSSLTLFTQKWLRDMD
ncbi:MAG: MFS transporter [SAR202 cluster bacterium]|nr:MFS transporter [SAR202 cluster bacterium]